MKKKGEGGRAAKCAEPRRDEREKSDLFFRGKSTCDPPTRKGGITKKKTFSRHSLCPKGSAQPEKALRGIRAKFEILRRGAKRTDASQPDFSKKGRSSAGKKAYAHAGRSKKGEGRCGGA